MPVRNATSGYNLPADIEEIGSHSIDDEERLFGYDDKGNHGQTIEEPAEERLLLRTVPSLSSVNSEQSEMDYTVKEYISRSPDLSQMFIYAVLWIITVGVFILSKTIPHVNITNNLIEKNYAASQKAWLSGPLQEYEKLSITLAEDEMISKTVTLAVRQESNVHKYRDVFYSAYMNFEVNLTRLDAGNIMEAVFIRVGDMGLVMGVPMAVAIIEENSASTINRTQKEFRDIRGTVGDRTNVGNSYRNALTKSVWILDTACVQIFNNGTKDWTLSTYNSTSIGNGCNTDHHNIWVPGVRYRKLDIAQQDVFSSLTDQTNTSISTQEGVAHNNTRAMNSSILQIKVKLEVRHKLDPELYIAACGSDLWLSETELVYLAGKLHTFALKCLAITFMFTVIITLYHHRKKRLQQKLRLKNLLDPVGLEDEYIVHE
eukprot:CFRG8476T1